MHLRTLGNNGVIVDQPNLLSGLLEHRGAQFVARSIVVEETLALVVDKDAAVGAHRKSDHQARAGSNVRMHLNSFEMRHLRAHVLAQIDAVTVRARLSRGHHAEEFRMVLAHERTVVGVAARCQKHGRSADAIQARVLAFDQNARHGAVLVALKTNHLRVDANICTGLFQRGLHFFDHVATDAARKHPGQGRACRPAIRTIREPSCSVRSTR